MEKKRRKKWKFSPYSVPLFLHIIGSIETPLFMAESGEKADIFSIFFFAFSLSKRKPIWRKSGE